MINKQQRTNREVGLENVMESMYGEDCGAVHASVKRKKKKVKEEDNPTDVVKEAGGAYMALRQEVDEYLTTAVHTTGAEDLKANILEIIDRHLGGGGQAAAAPSPAPTGPISSPARQSQSPHRSSGMSGPGMMP
tara:strand:- start:503 stop:904 length:402 start_codon:yes stop_codon:yes gene_type:complete